MSLQLSISQRRNGEPVLGAAVGAREEYACAIQRDGRIARSMLLSSSVQPSSRKQVSPPAHERIADCFSEFVF
jgi:hypothetical protein